MGEIDQDIVALLRKYVGNNCTRQELERVKFILSSGNYEQEWDLVLAETAANDMADDSDVPDFDAAGTLNRINASIRPARRLTFTNWTWGVAATLLLALSVGYLFLRNNTSSQAVNPILSLTTTTGQQKKITLTDGTEIVLNTGSTLKYSAKFTGTKREVYLDGEAFFNVKHDAQHPFLVHTGRLNVQVLGTSFNVRSYPADGRATVSVATGKVGVNGLTPTKTYMLLPGNRLSCNKNNVFKKDDVSVDDILGWQKGILIFRLETIEEIAPVLERYYGVSIHIKTAHLYDKQVTASFTQKTLPQVLEILSQTAGFSYAINKNEVHITNLKQGGTYK